MMKKFLKHFKEHLVSKIILLVLIILEVKQIISHEQFIAFAMVDVLLVDDIIAAFRTGICEAIIESANEMK